MPDSNLQLGEHRIRPSWAQLGWAIAYHFGYNGGRTISNDSNPQADGTYKTFNNAFNVSTTFRF